MTANQSGCQKHTPVPRHVVLKKVNVLLTFMLGFSYLILLSHKSFTVMDDCQPYDLGQDPPHSTRKSGYHEGQEESPKMLFQSTVNRTSNGENLCVLVRTFINHGMTLQQQILGWADKASGLKNNDPIQHISVFTINTHHEQNRTDDKGLVHLLQQTSELFPDALPMDLHFIPLPKAEPVQNRYGYDATNFLLRYTLDPIHKSHCDRYIFTNGDNSYHRDLLLSVNQWIRLGLDSDLIAFDFTSHHPRGGILNTKITTEFRFAEIDLGSAIVKRRVVTDHCGTPLLLFRRNPKLGAQDEWFAADFTFFEDAIRCKASGSIIRQVLFQHQ